jgi:hypothetical protein
MMTVQPRIAAIRALRLASHELENTCRTIVGGVPMAIGAATARQLAEDPREVEPDAMRNEEGGRA